MAKAKVAATENEQTASEWPFPRAAETKQTAGENTAAETKQTTGENTAAETQAAPAEKAPKVARGNSDKFVFRKDLAEGQKFAPQALLIIKHVKAHNTITRDQLCEELAKDPDFKTKQPVGRIVSYYQKDLVNAGLFSIEK